MQIRKLTPSEHVLLHGLHQSVFFGMERDDIREMMKNPLEHAQDDAHSRFGVFDERGTLQSAMEIIPYTMRMNCHNVHMGGVAGVVTRPESRERGHINLLFRTAFEEMLENRQIFSFLYPFSYAYYRKFGYELCHVRDKVKIPIARLAPYKCEVFAEPFEPGDDVAPYTKIYKYFIRERNLSIVRDDDAWEKLLDRDPYKKREFTYLFYDSVGRAVAYILYDAQEGRCVAVRELCWLNADALYLVFGFLARLGAEFDEILWDAPCDVNVYSLFPECGELSWQREVGGMNRLVDVSAALLTLRAPPRSGRVALAVTDNFLPQNTGVYAVEWESGAISVEKLDAVGPMPDIETGVETLAQLVTGFLTPEAAMQKKDTAVLGTLAGLNALFPRRNLYLMERF